MIQNMEVQMNKTYNAFFFLPLSVVLLFLITAFTLSPNNIQSSMKANKDSPSSVVMLDTLAYENIVSENHPGLKIEIINSGGWQLVWYEGMLTAQKSEATPIDTLYVSHSDTIFECEDATYSDTLKCEYSETYTTLSIIGNIVSYERSYDGNCGMHPTYGAQYCTIEIGTKREDIPITNLFPEGNIFNAFYADTIIQHYLTIKQPINLNELIKHLDGECEVSFYDLLSSWSIYDIGSDSVVIVFGLKYGCEAMRGQFTTIQITLPVPDAHRDLFLQAKKNGIVSKNMRDYHL
jgi:hypothetical protein